MVTPIDRLRIAALAARCERSVRRVYDGKGNDYTRAAVKAAAQELGLPLPPAPSTDSSRSSPTTSRSGSKIA
jgi:hypothetical protein